MAGSYATLEGALYELVSRGKKDTFFFEESKDSLYVFDNTYEAQAPQMSEIRRIPSQTSCDFGRNLQFDFDLVGDIMRDPTLVIKLPSWLPSNIESSNPRTEVADLSGVTYGYTNGIAYFLFEQIQFYQDNILLQEFSGDALWATTRSADTLGHSLLSNTLTGVHNGMALDIARNATPGQLRLALPIIGCQQPSDLGFPQRAALKHTYRLKCKLRKLEDLVESSDGRYKPTPWGANMFQQTSQNGTQTEFHTLFRTEILPLDVQLETRQVYIPREYQDALQQTPQKIPFLRMRENIFTQNRVDYVNTAAGGVSIIKRLLDGRHPAEKITWFFRARQDINANRLWKLNTGTQSAQSYYSSANFQIAGRDRELPRSPLVWRDVTNYAKESTDTGYEIGTMNWGLGAIAPQRFPEARVTGAVNFTTADRPTMYFSLNPVTPDPLVGSPNTELRVIVEGWAEFNTDGKGRAELFMA